MLLFLDGIPRRQPLRIASTSTPGRTNSRPNIHITTSGICRSRLLRHTLLHHSATGAVLHRHPSTSPRHGGQHFCDASPPARRAKVRLLQREALFHLPDRPGSRNPPPIIAVGKYEPAGGFRSPIASRKRAGMMMKRDEPARTPHSVATAPVTCRRRAHSGADQVRCVTPAILGIFWVAPPERPRVLGRTYRLPGTQSVPGPGG